MRKNLACAGPVGDEDYYNDIIASWECSDGRYAILYANANYTGYSLETDCAGFEEDLTDPALENQISSIQIFECDTLVYGGKGCIMYSGYTMGGTYLSSEVSVPNLIGVNFPDGTPSDDQISSVFCFPGYGVFLFQNINYGGAEMILNPGDRRTDLSHTTPPFDNEISSFEIYRVGYCCFYTDVDYTGNEFCTSNNVIRLGPTYFQTISSWDCYGASFILYDTVNLQGASLSRNCDDSVDDASTISPDWENRAESLTIYICENYMQ